MPKGIPGPNVTMNSGRRAQGSPIAKNTHKPTSLGTTRMNQAQDSGGGTLNFEPANFQSNSLKAASKAPIVGQIPGTVAAGNPIGAPGSGKVDKKVAGIQKFYGR